MVSGYAAGPYFLWAVPRGRTAERLKAEIAHLAQRHGGAVFEPHVTILGGIAGSEEQVLATMRQLAARVQKYRITFNGVAAGTSFYRCVYLSGDKAPATMAAAEAAEKAYDMTPAVPYTPHLSLLYGDLSQEERAAAAEHAAGRLLRGAAGGKGVEAGGGGGRGPLDGPLEELGFDVTHFVMAYTPLEDVACSTWCVVGEAELAG